VEVEARACPLRQLQKTHGGVGALPYLPPEQHATLPASEDVTAVTGYSSSTPIIFWTPCAPMHFLDNQRSVRQLTHLSRIRPLKSGDIDLALGGGIEKAGGNDCPTLPVEYRTSS
jgi:hypothetical protein